MAGTSKLLVWLSGEVKTPPFSEDARVEAGVLLRRLQRGEKLGMPHSRPMSIMGPKCHELRIVDEGRSWRIMYRTDADAIVIADVGPKTTRQTPPRLITVCRDRFRRYDLATGGG